jgi:hypothetical protein
MLRLAAELPLIDEERFIEDISVMQALGQIKIENGMVTKCPK